MDENFIFSSGSEDYHDEKKLAPSFGHKLLAILDRHADRTLLLQADSERRWTGAQMKERVLNIATALVELHKIPPGSVIALSCEHSDVEILLGFGIIVAGYSLSYLYPKEHYLEVLCKAKSLEPKLMFCIEENLGWAKQLSDELGYTIEAVPIAKRLSDNLEKSTSLGAYFNYDLSSSNASSLLPRACQDPFREVAVFVYSSGTSGSPKIVPTTHAIMMFEVEEGLDPNTINTIQTGYEYVTGRINLSRSLANGQLAIIFDDWTPEYFCRLVEKYKMQTLGIGPASVLALINDPAVDKYDISSIKYICPAGAKMTFADDFKNFLDKHKHIKTVATIYGATEAHAVSYFRKTVDDYFKDVTNVGPMTLGYKAKVVDRGTGRLLGPNEKGILHVKSKLVMPGYYDMERGRKRAKENGGPIDPFFGGPEVFDEEGYYITGDVAYFNDNQELIVEGREADLLVLKTGGKAVVQALEELVARHPAVAEAHVVGIPHKVLKDAIMFPRVFVTIDQSCTEANLDSFMSTRVSPEMHTLLEYTGSSKLCSLPTEMRRRLSRDILEFGNERLTWWSDLNGGVVILDAVPKLRRSGKVDRVALKSLGTDVVEIYGDKTSCLEEI